MISALIRKNKKKISTALSYFVVLLVLIVNILFTVFLVNDRFYSYIVYGSNEQVKQLFTKYNHKYYNIITGSNPLLASVMFERDKEIIEFFIDKGDDVNIENYFGITPLSYAVTEASSDVVDLLIKNGADVNFKSRNKHKSTLLMDTIILNKNSENKEKIVELLINAGADVNALSSSGGTALSYASLIYNNKGEAPYKDRSITLRTIELLLEAGANPFLKSVGGALSQYEVAQNFKNTELINLFEKYIP